MVCGSTGQTGFAAAGHAADEGIDLHGLYPLSDFRFYQVPRVPTRYRVIKSRALSCQEILVLSCFTLGSETEDV